MSAITDHHCDIYDPDSDAVLQVDDWQGDGIVTITVVDGNDAQQIRLDTRGARQLRLALTRWERAQKT